MSTNDNSRVQRGAPSGALSPADPANQSQEVARARPATHGRSQSVDGQ
jgi:hypothetical protein